LRFVYGVHGYGRGHAMRARAVLPSLMQRHDVCILAGGAAYDALSSDYVVTRIPVLEYHHDARGKLSNYLTAKRNVSLVLDVLWQGPGLQMVMNIIKDFGPDCVLTDSETYTHRAAARLGIPRITFDHFGVLVYGKTEFKDRQELARKGNAWVYRTLFGEPDRAVVTWFYDAPPKRDGVAVVGPVMRRELLDVTPTRGPHLLAYFSIPREQFTPSIEQALMALDCPVRVYGTDRRGMQKNLVFKPLANLPFIEDLASCRAVLATTGNQLCGEVIHFGKPMLGIPLDCLEQRANACALEWMGVGRWAKPSRITAELLREFLSREDEYRRNMPRASRDGAAEAIEAIERFAVELTSRRSGSRPGSPTTTTATAPNGRASS
jgi:uncharacterized protein (TIGR00661 family)